MKYGKKISAFALAFAMSHGVAKAQFGHPLNPLNPLSPLSPLHDDGESSETMSAEERKAALEALEPILKAKIADPESKAEDLKEIMGNLSFEDFRQGACRFLDEAREEVLGTSKPTRVATDHEVEQIMEFMHNKDLERGVLLLKMFGGVAAAGALAFGAYHLIEQSRKRSSDFSPGHP